MSSDPSVRAFADLPRLGRVNVVLLVAAVLALSFRLWPDWRHNPDLSHGLFMPIVFAVLVNEARRGTPRFLRRTRRVTTAFVALLVAGLTALVAAGLYAASVDWSHPLVNLSLTTSLVCFLGAALLVFADDGIRFVPWNWTALVAIALWLLCTPIPPGTYTRLTLSLQIGVSEAVLRALHLLGIPALRHGNIIELAQTSVGVEDACSGVRSLISCVFAGLFFSATLVRRRWGRVLTIALAAPLALVMNFVRSLTLTLLASGGVDIRGTWHDVTGLAVLGVTAALLAGIAYLSGRGTLPSASVVPPAGRSRGRGRFTAMLGTFGVALALVFFSIVNTRPSVRQDAPAPNLDAVLPKRAPGWQVATTDDLYRFQDTLQTDHLVQRTYRKLTSETSGTEIILYVAYWHAGQAPVSLVASHTPDACWPGSGWTQRPLEARANLIADGRALPTAEQRLFTFNGFPQYVWFWHLYDGRPISYRDPYSPVELLRIALKYGFRHDGDQLFVRVSSNRPWAEIKDEPLVQEFFDRAKQIGL